MFESKNLILDFEKNEYSFDLKLIHDVDLDFDNKGSLSNNGLILDNLFFHFDFSEYYNINQIDSHYSYQYCSGYSNKFRLLSTGETLSLQTDIFLNKQVLFFDGGHLISSIGEELPFPFEKGFNLNYWINFNSNVNEGNIFKIGDEMNGYSFYYKNGKLGFKSYVERINFTGGTIIEEKILESPTIYDGDGNKWLNITIDFKRNQEFNKCCVDDENVFSDQYSSEFGITDEKIMFPACTDLSEIPDIHKGKLTFLVNGRPIFSQLIEEPIIYNNILTIGEGFNGYISIVSLYSRNLTIPEIIRNYYAYKTIYKRVENFGGVDIKVNSDLVK